MQEQLYSVYRMYQDGRKRRRMRKDLTLEQAQEHCNDPETSSMTAARACHGSDNLIKKWHDQQKHWFDGYERQ